jgi:hypothetical protein
MAAAYLWLVRVWGAPEIVAMSYSLGRAEASATRTLGLGGTGRSRSGVNPTKRFVTADAPSHRCSNLAVHSQPIYSFIHGLA